MQQLLRLVSCRYLFAAPGCQCSHQSSDLNNLLRPIGQQRAVVVGHDHAFANRMSQADDLQPLLIHSEPEFQLLIAAKGVRFDLPQSRIGDQPQRLLGLVQ